jgi:hypothetical protein
VLTGRICVDEQFVINPLLKEKPMLKQFLLPAALALTPMSASYAGGLAATVVEPIVVQEAPPTMSSANGLIIPLIIVALIALAANDGGKDSSSGGGGVAESDMRLKTDILRVGTSPSGLGIYQFRYLGGDGQLYQGAMAQEVAQVNPAAVIHNPAGYLSVDYSQIDVAFVALD